MSSIHMDTHLPASHSSHMAWLAEDHVTFFAALGFVHMPGMLTPGLCASGLLEAIPNHLVGPLGCSHRALGFFPYHLQNPGITLFLYLLVSFLSLSLRVTK
jgi:hypothetical protein